MPGPTTLSVRGEASLEVLADSAVVSLQVRRQDADRELATAAAAQVADAVRVAVGAAIGVRRSTISRLQVSEVTEWDDRTRSNVRRGWEATLGGTVLVEADSVGAMAGDLVAAGAEILGVEWRVDDDNAARREVRRLAVADAARAAADFASAVGGSVGALLELADPGLMTSAPQGAISRSGLAARPVALGLAGGGLGAIEVDPQVMTLHAVVEARYQRSTD